MLQFWGANVLTQLRHSNTYSPWRRERQEGGGGEVGRVGRGGEGRQEGGRGGGQVGARRHIDLAHLLAVVNLHVKRREGDPGEGGVEGREG